jgi:uncharacterized membrane protein
MYLIAIAWIYVVLMMAVAEAISSQGTVLGAVITFLLYGVLPLGLVLYIFGTPARKRARALDEAAAAVAEPLAAQTSASAPASSTSTSTSPNSSGHAPGDTLAAERKET